MGIGKTIVRALANLSPEKLIEYLIWRNKTDATTDELDTYRLGQELDYAVEISPACEMVWVAAIPSMGKQYRASELIPLINALLVKVTADVTITDATRSNLIERLKSIQIKLREINARRN